ncbi:WD repeat-containing protein 64-like [Erythrolamprus reginae]|uniref:WD repeat-containing protein 64-like n=1 Tax=Erythrolamprus reginae TaxID=121349 RepID=UPI00396CE4AA
MAKRQGIGEERTGSEGSSGCKTFWKRVRAQNVAASKEHIEERSGTEQEMNYDKFFDAVKILFGPDVKAQDVKTFYRKISNNPDGQTEWCEIFGYYMVEGDILADQLDEENMVFLVSKKQRIAKAGVKRSDVFRCMVKIPQLDFLLTASQKGVISIFSGQVILKYREKVVNPWLHTPALQRERWYQHVGLLKFSSSLWEGKNSFPQGLEALPRPETGPFPDFWNLR